MGGRDLWGDGWTLLLKLSSSKTLRSFGSEVAARGLPSFSAQPPIKHAWCRKYAQVVWLCLYFLHFVPKLIHWIYSDNQRKADFLWIKEWHRQLWQTHAIIGSLLSLHLPGGVLAGGRSAKVHRPQLEKLLSYDGNPQPGPGVCPIFGSFFNRALLLRSCHL